MTGQLDAARTHVRQRQSDDLRMEESVQEALRTADEPRSRENLAQLLRTLQGASLLRSQLVNDISVAPDRFLESQRSVFRARRPTGLPDLESRLFPQMLTLAVGQLADNADQIISALYPPTCRRSTTSTACSACCSSSVLTKLTLRLTTVSSPRTRRLWRSFPEAIVKQVTHWLTMKFEGGETFRIDQLLELAEDEGMDRPMRRCLVLILFRSFSNSETEFKNMRAHITGSFHLDVAQGTNIEFTPKGGINDNSSKQRTKRCTTGLQGASHDSVTGQ